MPSAGALDPTFGVGGKLTTAFLGPTNDFELAGTVLQPDGKVVVAGSCEPSSQNLGGGFALARYNTDGSLDTTFGTGGKVIPTFGQFTSRAQAVALQSDGKIVAAGWAFNGSSVDFAVIRYNRDGSLDTTFGAGGEVLSVIGGQATAIAIQGDGKIVVAGHAPAGSNQDFGLVRLNTDGSLDTTFGTSGEVLTAFGSDPFQQVNSLAIQSDGAIVAAGESATPTGLVVALARYTPGGSLDTTFNGSGEVLTAVGSLTPGGFTSSDANGVAIQGDGKIVVSGTAYTGAGTGQDAALVRYNHDGSLDANFGTGGEVTTDFGSGSDFGRQVVIQSNGDIVAVGNSVQSSTGPDFALARYTPTGSLDTTFGTGGKILTDFGDTQDFATGVVLQTNGSIVAAGESIQAATGMDFALARYTTTGSLDTTFGSGGQVTTNLDLSPIDAYGKGGVAIQADGKLVVAGTANRGFTGGGYEFALARYNSNGTLDTSFGTGGQVATAFPGQAIATSEVIQPDGKIVLAGSTLVANQRSDYALVRYNPDGSLDTSFGVGGEVDTPFGSFSVDANSVALQADGKIVVVGDVGPFSQGFSMARYNPDGSLDTSFGTSGRVLTATINSESSFNSVAIQADGKVVAAGDTVQNKSLDFALLRFNSDGSTDTSFGSKGEVLSSFNNSNFNQANSVVIQPDGKIVAAGESNQVTGDFALARYNSDGSPDKSFGKNGQVLTDFAGTFDEAFSLALQGDGKIVAAGETIQGPAFSPDFALARYNYDGSLDQSFGNGGRVVTDFGGESQVIGVAIQPDGNIVAAGTAFQNGVGFEFALARYIGVSPSTPTDAVVGILNRVEGLVDGGVLNNGQGNALEAKLQQAIEHLGDGNTATAANDLQAFVNEVNDFLGQDVLSSAVGQPLIDDADLVIALLQKK